MKIYLENVQKIDLKILNKNVKDSSGRSMN